ncbi:MAG: cbb3-type cytochrome oxidase assembly protein CcoS [Gammaproteobacteria bacterium]|nr:cbb3-type cytochrome oxidase assembly protein CcoS [Gammaproteobacteria bacterium]
MEILYLLIPLGLVIFAIAIWAFVWAVKSGQFDDMEGPAHRILMDDDDPRIPGKKTDPGLKDRDG